MAKEKTDQIQPQIPPTESSWQSFSVTYPCKHSTEEKPLTHKGLISRNSLLGEGAGKNKVYALDVLKDNGVRNKAVKIVPFDDDQTIAKFQKEFLNKEAKFGQMLSHLGMKPAIMNDWGGMLVMKLLPGTELTKVIFKHLIGKHPLTINQILELGEQLLKALNDQVTSLKDKKNRSLIHCDIKPANILVNLDDKIQVNIADFGIAMREGERRRIVMGTIHYIAPEVAKEQDYSPAADIYAMGKIMAFLSLFYFNDAVNFYKNNYDSENDAHEENEKKFNSEFRMLQLKEEYKELQFLKEIIMQMTELDPKNRPDITQLIKSFSTEKERYLASKEQTDICIAASSSSSIQESENPQSFFARKSDTNEYNKDKAIMEKPNIVR